MQDSRDVAYLFLDTNVILHYKAFHSIPWPQLVGKPVCLVFAIAVIDELDKKKYEAQQEHLRERARSMLPKIEDAVEGSLSLPKDTRAQLYVNEQIDWERYGLDRTSSDDHFIGQVLRFRDTTGHADVRIVTADTGMRLRVQRVGLQCLHLGDDYLLPVPDEVQSLKRELARLKNRMPKLTLGFRSGNKIVPHLRVNMPPCPPPLTEQDVEDALRSIREKYPRMIFGDLSDYMDRYRTYLKKRWEWADRSARTIELNLVIENAGTAPAEDLDVVLSFPRIVSVSGTFPASPKPPRPPLQSLVDESLWVNPPWVNPFDATDDWSEAEVDGDTVTVSCSLGTLKHGLQYACRVLYVTFHTYEDIAPFQVSYDLLAANLLEPVTGTLHVMPKVAKD